MCIQASARTSAADGNDAAELNKNDAWLSKFDYDGFTAEIRALGKKLEAEQGPEDVAHLNKMILWSNMCAAVGLLTMGLGINPISVFGLSLYAFTRWTMIAHHTCHGGYEKVHPNLSRWSRFKFGLGTFWRRFYDWFDWMMPEAWNVEHNNRHHYNLSEFTDPDLVENNMSELRASNMPFLFKYAAVAFIMVSWKWFYYAPNTYKELKMARLRRAGKKMPEGIIPEDALTLKGLLVGQTQFYSLWEFFSVVAGPYLIIHFFLVPLPWYLVGEYLPLAAEYGYTSGLEMYKTAVINLFIADVVTNIHSFIAIVTNHAGDDMYRFRDACRPFSGSFYLRQVLASADYAMGTDLIDFMHGYLNYQIEHHLWPNLSMRSYQKSAPLVQEICQRYGVPYVKHSVFWRLKQTVDIMVGARSMRWFPAGYEKRYLEMDARAEAQKKK